MDLKKHLETAADAVRRRNYPYAIKVYGQLLEIQPDSGEARAGLREALFRKVEQKPASRGLAYVVGGPSLLLAGMMRLMRQHGAAAKAYERFLALDPTNEGANLRLGEALQNAGFSKSALAVYEAYARHEPRCLEASRSAGALLYESGRLDDALAMYEQALKVDPRDQESLRARKNLAAEGALAKTGLEKASSSRELIKDKAGQRKLERSQRLQLSKEEIGRELDELEAELGERPDDVKLLKKVARYREMDGDLQGALDCLERVLDLGPDAEVSDLVGDLRLKNQERMVAEARARGDDGAAERAQAALTEARAVEFRRRADANPADLGLRFALGEVLFEQGDLDGAIAELQQAIKDPRNRVSALLTLGRAFQNKGLHDLAKGQYEKGLEAVTDSTARKELLYRLGTLCEDIGQSADALTHYSKILEEDIAFRDVAAKVEALKAS